MMGDCESRFGPQRRTSRETAGAYDELHQHEHARTFKIGELTLSTFFLLGLTNASLPPSACPSRDLLPPFDGLDSSSESVEYWLRSL